MKGPFTLYSNGSVSTDTIRCLEELLREAKAGEVIGVCYAAMHKRRQYTVHSCGEAYRNPTFSRGMVSALDDHLSTRVNGSKS